MAERTSHEMTRYVLEKEYDNLIEENRELRANYEKLYHEKLRLEQELEKTKQKLSDTLGDNRKLKQGIDVWNREYKQKRREESKIKSGEQRALKVDVSEGLVMHYKELGYSQKEIAEELGVSLSTVRRRLEQARYRTGELEVEL